MILKISELIKIAIYGQKKIKTISMRTKTQ